MVVGTVVKNQQNLASLPGQVSLGEQVLISAVPGGTCFKPESRRKTPEQTKGTKGFRRQDGPLPTGGSRDTIVSQPSEPDVRRWAISKHVAV